MSRFGAIKLAAAGLALTCILLTNGPAGAACAFTVTQTQALAWGTWQQPSSGSQTADITTADALSGTGTKLYGTSVHGAFTISNNPQCSGTLTIAVSNTGGATGVALSNFHLVFNGVSIANPASGITMPGTSGKTLLVGATATYTNAVTVGSESPTFNIQTTDSGTGKSVGTSETATIGFDVPITFNKVSDINFGTVTDSNASTYRMSTAGVGSVVSGTGQLLTGTQSAANITIIGSATDGITIQAAGYTANQGVTPSNATCAYNGGASTACSSAITGVAPGSGKTLLVGVDVAASGTQAGITATPSFTINVNYQ